MNSQTQPKSAAAGTTVESRNLRRLVQGVVTSDKMNKTIVVRSNFLVRHPVYKKYMRKHSIYKAHDEDNVAKTGDLVEIQETRPLSKTKHWRLVRVVKPAGVSVETIAAPQV